MIESFVVGIFGAACWEIIRRAATCFLPKIIDQIQRRPDLNGSWVASFSDSGSSMTEWITVRSSGASVRATSEVYIDQSFYKKYQFHGTIEDRIINLQYRNLDKRSFEQGAIVLQLLPEGQQAKGTYVYLADSEPDVEDIVSIPYSWKREQSA